MKIKTLYICYFGIREPLVQTQVLPYLKELQKDGEVDTSLLTFEPRNEAADIAEFEKIEQELSTDGIAWRRLRYHKRPSAIATAWDIFCGVREIRRSLGSVDVLHARSHVPMMMAGLARKFSRSKPKIVFDIRGFMPEEYADAGVWTQGGTMFRLVKRIEKWLMRQADGFVVLTGKARTILFENEPRPVEVIPCCVDLETRFGADRAASRKAMRAALGAGDRFVIAHVGALGGLYLTNEIVDLLAAARDSRKVFAMFLTQSDPALVRDLLRSKGFGEEDVLIEKVSPDRIAEYLSAADVGLSFVKSSYATQSRSPTKIPEYLACGVPVIANSGVGDVDDLILRNGVGAVVNVFEPGAYKAAIERIIQMGDVSDRCRETAAREFDLKIVGGVRYRRLYSDLLRTSGEV